MAVELHCLSKSFDGKPALVQLSHRFSEGVTCITGPSGCGKTTLLRILLGLETPDSGTVTGLPHICAAVFQEDRLVETLSAQTNIRIALRRGYPRAEILAALDAVGLGGASRQSVSTLSGGMRRRVAIVRALLSDAPVLVMDEPFEGLDANTKSRTIKFVRDRLAGRTALIVTHDVSDAVPLGGVIWNMQNERTF